MVARASRVRPYADAEVMRSGLPDLGGIAGRVAEKVLSNERAQRSAVVSSLRAVVVQSQAANSSPPKRAATSPALSARLRRGNLLDGCPPPTMSGRRSPLEVVAVHHQTQNCSPPVFGRPPRPSSEKDLLVKSPVNLVVREQTGKI